MWPISTVRQAETLSAPVHVGKRGCGPLRGPRDLRPVPAGTRSPAPVPGGRRAHLIGAVCGPADLAMPRLAARIVRLAVHSPPTCTEFLSLSILKAVVGEQEPDRP